MNLFFPFLFCLTSSLNTTKRNAINHPYCYCRVCISFPQPSSFHHLHHPHAHLTCLLHLPRSRSPISAIQSVFECAVVLLGSADVSWRAVRHATQDDNFCVRLAAVCVPALTQAVVSTLADKLEVIHVIVALIVD